MIEVSPKTTSVKDVEQILGKLLTDQSYPVANLKRVCEEMAEVLEKPQPSKYAQSRPLKLCKVPPDAQVVDKAQAVQVITRALKIMLYPQHK